MGLGVVDPGVGGSVDDDVGPHLVDGPTYGALVGDVEVGPGEPDHLVTGVGQHGDQVGAELSASTRHQPARHGRAALDFKGSHH